MKYLSTSIILSVVIFVAINGKKHPRLPQTRKITPSPPNWDKWEGKYPFSVQVIVDNAINLFYRRTGNYFKFMDIVLKQTAFINGSRRYKVIYNAAKCILGKPKKCIRKGRKCPNKGKINIVGWVRKNTLFQAILKDNKLKRKLKLNVTNLENDESYEKIYNRQAKQFYKPIKVPRRMVKNI
uniref:Cystatin domain-containing protein n=1 Tax=Strongyloides papillosus TaxID=174720 RepID=A0A0N5BC90_STREA